MWVEVSMIIKKIQIKIYDSITDVCGQHNCKNINKNGRKLIKIN